MTVIPEVEIKTGSRPIRVSLQITAPIIGGDVFEEPDASRDCAILNLAPR